MPHVISTNRLVSAIRTRTALRIRSASAVRSRHDMARNKERVYSYFPRLHERRGVASG